MKRILFIQPSLGAVGGIEKVIPSVASALAQDGFSVFAYTFYDHIPESQTFWSVTYEEYEKPTHNVTHKLVKVYRRVRNIIRFIEKNRPSHVIVSAQGAIVTVLALRLVRLIRIPVIAYIHEGRNDGGFFYRVLTALFYPVADGHVCVSKGILTEIRNIPFVKKDKVVLAYNAVPDRVQSSKDEQKADEMIKGLERPIFINAGRFELTKGTDVLIKSFLSYAKTHPGTLLMLGSGSLEGELQNLVKSESMDNRIEFLGRVEDSRAYISLADLYVSCARSEPFGLALVEALSVGIPVVATDCPSGPREILSPDTVPDSYPYMVDCGVMMPPSSEDFEANALAFEQAADLAISHRYSREVLFSRAKYFSVSEQSGAIKSLLGKL